MAGPTERLGVNPRRYFTIAVEQRYRRARRPRALAPAVARPALPGAVGLSSASAKTAP